MDPVTFTVIIGLAALLAIGWLEWKQHLLSSNLPGPRGLPLLGNAILFSGTLLETFTLLRRLFRAHGPVVRVWIGPRLYVFLSAPADAQLVLGNPRVRNRDENMSAAMRPFFGNGLLSTRDEEWRAHRKLITPTFHFAVLETYVQVFAAKAAILLHKFDKFAAAGAEVDVYDALSLCTLDAICETAIGTALDCQGEGRSAFRDLLVRGTALVHNRVIKPWLLLPWLYPWTSDGREARPLIAQVDAFVGDLVRRRTANHETPTPTSRRLVTILDMLLEDKTGALTERELRDEVTTLAAAGLETTATVMGFTLLLLAMHPEEQHKVQCELDVVLADKEVPDKHDLSQLVQLDCVLRETLRLFPVVSLLPRELPEDIVLKSGLVLPRGATAVVAAYELHRDPGHFECPDAFMPARWAGRDPAAHPFSYLPFSAGARNCVGQKYATLQMKTVLSAVLRRFSVTTSLTMEALSELEMSITLSLLPGYRVTLQPRHGGVEP